MADERYFELEIITPDRVFFKDQVLMVLLRKQTIPMLYGQKTQSEQEIIVRQKQ